MVSNSQNNQFYQSDLNPMTLVLKRDLDIVHHTKYKASMWRHSKVIAQTDRHTDSMRTLPFCIRGR